MFSCFAFLFPAPPIEQSTIATEEPVAVEEAVVEVTPEEAAPVVEEPVAAPETQAEVNAEEIPAAKPNKLAIFKKFSPKNLQFFKKKQQKAASDEEAAVEIVEEAEVTKGDEKQPVASSDETLVDVAEPAPVAETTKSL